QDLALVVDEVGGLQLPAGVERETAVQVRHFSVGVEEGLVPGAHDLAAVVDPGRLTLGAGDLGILEAALRVIDKGASTRLADNHPGVVQAVDQSLGRSRYRQRLRA